MPELEEIITEIELRKRWPMSRSTLIRARRAGLKFFRIGAFICYAPRDVEAWFLKPRSWKASRDDERTEDKNNAE